MKARIAKYVIERAEAEGRLNPGDTIVEASSRKHRECHADVVAANGCPMLVVMPSGGARNAPQSPARSAPRS